MSCLIMKDESVSVLANFIADQMNHGFNNTGMSTPDELYGVFGICRDRRGYVQGSAVFKVLVEENIKAYNSGYARSPYLSKGGTQHHKIDVHKPLVYKDNHPVVEEWHYKIKKLLDFYEYQLFEDATKNGYVHKAIIALNSVLTDFIVRNSDIWQSLPWGDFNL